MSSENERHGLFTPERLALSCFVLYVAVAYPLILFHYGKDEWFIHNDWDLITGSGLAHLFRPQEHHWMTVPILISRVYYGLFGAAYFPFLATVSLVHLSIASLLRTLMRRSGVGPWLSTLTAGQLVLFGPGCFSIVFAIQIGQNLSLALGLAQMLLADHDGDVDRRDYVGLSLGFIALMSSGLTPIMVVAVGLAALVRRGVRAAAFHTIPLASVFLVWFFSMRSDRGADLLRLPYGESQPVAFLWNGLLHSVTALGHFAAVGAAMVLLTVGGTLLHFTRFGKTALASFTLPLSLLACAPLYFAILGVQRSRLGVDYVGWSHHLYTGACFFLPIFACGAEAVVRRWRIAAPLLATALLSLIPVNVRSFGTSERNIFLAKPFLQQNRRRLMAIAHSPYASRVLRLDPSKRVTDPWYSRELTVGWAVAQAKKGKLPNPGTVDPDLDDFVHLFYGLTDLGRPAPETKCTDVFGSLEVRPREGTMVATGSPVVVVDIRRSRDSSGRIVFDDEQGPNAGHVLRVELPDLRLQLEPIAGAKSFAYCAGSSEIEVVRAQPSDAFARAIEDDPVATENMRKAIEADPAAKEAVRKAIQADPRAQEAVRKAILEDPAAQEAVRKALERGER